MFAFPLRSVVLAGLLGIAFVPRTAGAQSAAGAAEALFEQGRTAMQSGDLETACQRFRESNRLDPAAGTALNLAVCEEKRGRLATAWELFRSAGDALPDGDSRVAIARQHASALEARLPRLMITLAAGAPADTVVVRDDVELRGGSLGVSLPVDPGKHALTVRAPGRAERRFGVELAEGEQKQIEVTPGAVAAAAAGAPGTASQPTEAQHTTVPSTGGSGEVTASSGSSRTAGFVVGGAGIVGIGVGVVTGIMTLGERKTVDSHCSDALRVCDPTGKNAADRGRTLGAISTVGFVVGGAALVLGGYLVLSGGPSGERAASGTVQSELGAGIGPDGARLHFRAVW